MLLIANEPFVVSIFFFKCSGKCTPNLLHIPSDRQKDKKSRDRKTGRITDKNIISLITLPRYKLDSAAQWSDLLGLLAFDICTLWSALGN